MKPPHFPLITSHYLNTCHYQRDLRHHRPYLTTGTYRASSLKIRKAQGFHPGIEKEGA